MKIDVSLTRPNDKWFSERGIPLITQPLSLPKEAKRILTVERYEKWYHLYLVNVTNNMVFNTFECDYDPYAGYIEDMWHDHCIIPSILVKYAKVAGYEIDLQTYDAVCRRYIQDWMGCNAVFTSEFCDDVAQRYDNQSVDMRFNKDAFPITEELQSVLVKHDIELII